MNPHPALAAARRMGRAAMILTACALVPSTPAHAEPPQPAYTRSRPITPGTPVPPSTGLLIACDAAGYVRLKMAGGGTIDLYCPQGTAAMDGYSIVGVDAANTTASARVTALY